jgi:hypothetical protein
MAWNFVSSLAIAPRRRVIATAIVYGLSLAVRFTSATGEQVEIPAQSVERTHPVMSIMTKDGTGLPYADWGPNAAQPIFFRHGPPLRVSSMASCPLLSN